jgi:hypothetical protein
MLAGTPGMDYYLKADRRAVLLAAMRETIGRSTRLRTQAVPSTVGVWLSATPDGRTQFLDLVNYDYDPAADTVRPQNGLELALKLPAAGTEPSVRVLGGRGSASVAVRSGWALIRLERLDADAILELKLAP